MTADLRPTPTWYDEDGAVSAERLAEEAAQRFGIYEDDGSIPEYVWTAAVAVAGGGAMSSYERMKTLAEALPSNGAGVPSHHDTIFLAGCARAWADEGCGPRRQQSRWTPARSPSA